MRAAGGIGSLPLGTILKVGAAAGVILLIAWSGCNVLKDLSRQGEEPTLARRDMVTLKGARGLFTVRGPEAFCEIERAGIQRSRVWSAYFSRQPSGAVALQFETTVERELDRRAISPMGSRYRGGTATVKLVCADPVTGGVIGELSETKPIPTDIEAGSRKAAQEKAFSTAEADALQTIVSKVDAIAIPAIVKARNFGPAYAPILVEVWAGRDDEMGRLAKNAVDELGTEAMDALVSALEDRRGERLGFVKALGAMGSDARAAIPALKTTRTWEGAGHSGALMLAAQRALIRIQWAGREIPAQEFTREKVFDLIRRLQAENGPLHAKALGELGQRARESTPALLEAIETSKQWEVRHQAAIASSQILAATPDMDATEMVAVPAKAVESDPSPEVRAAAANLLGQIGRAAAEAIPVLRAARTWEGAEGKGIVMAAAHAALLKIEWPDGDAPPGERTRGSVYGFIRTLQTEADAVAAEGLGKLGPGASEAVPALVEALATKDDAVARSAAWALGRIGPRAQEALPAIKGALKADDAYVRITAAAALAKIDNAAIEPMPVLISALTTGQAGERVAAANAAAEIGPRAKGAVAALIAVLKNGTPEERTASANALGTIGPNASPAAEALRSARTWEGSGHRGEVMLSAQRALLKIQWPEGGAPPEEGTGEAVRRLIMELQSDAAASRQRAANGLAGMANAAREAVPALLEALRDREGSGARPQIVKALGAIGPESRSAVPELVAILRDDGRKPLHEPAIETLGRIGPGAKEAVSILVEALSREAPLSGASALALQSICPDSGSLVAPLLAALKAADSAAVRAAAAEALGRVGPGAATAIGDLAAVLSSDGNAGVRMAVARALGKIGPKSAGVLGVLTRALQDQDARVRETAAVTLGDMGSSAREAVDRLAAVLKEDADPAVRRHAAKALTQISPTDRMVARALQRALRSEDRELRMGTVQALAAVGPDAKEMAGHLVTTFRRDEDLDVRLAAARAVQAIDPSNQVFIFALRSALRDKTPKARKLAADIIAQLGAKAVEAVPNLIKALKEDEETEVRMAVAQALARVAPGTEEVMGALKEASQDADRDLVEAARSLLKRMAQPPP